jgi:hypothetical protein
MRRRWLLAAGGITLLLVVGSVIGRGQPNAFTAKVNESLSIWCCLEAGNSCRKVFSQDCIKEGGVLFNDSESVCSGICKNLRELPKSDMRVLSACACAPDGSAACAVTAPNAGPKIAPESILSMRLGAGLSIEEVTHTPAILECADPLFENRWTASADRDPDGLGVSALFQNISPLCKVSFFPVLSGRGQMQISAVVNGGLDPDLGNNNVTNSLGSSCVNFAASPTGSVCNKNKILYVARIFQPGYAEAEITLPIDECLDPASIGGIEPNGQCFVDVENRRLRCPHLMLADRFGAMVTFMANPMPPSKICVKGKAIRAQAEIVFRPSGSLPGAKKSTAAVEHSYCLCTQNDVTCDAPKSSSASSKKSFVAGAYCCLGLESGVDCNANVSLQECEVARGTWSDSLSFCRQICGFRGGSKMSESSKSSAPNPNIAIAASVSSSSRKSPAAASSQRTSAAPLVAMRYSSSSMVPVSSSSSQSEEMLHVSSASAATQDAPSVATPEPPLQEASGLVVSSSASQVAGLPPTLESDIPTFPPQEPSASSISSAVSTAVMHASAQSSFSRTGPEAILIMVLGAVGGYVWVRRRGKGSQ